MSTRANDQQRKQRQKEFLEKKAHQEMLKAAAKKAKRIPGKGEGTGGINEKGERVA